MFLVYYANVWTEVTLFRQVRWIQELEQIAGLETTVKIEVERQQALNAAHEAKIIWYIDLATVEEVKAKNYQEGFEKVKDELSMSTNLYS
ncbi:hypothetical protein DVH24_011928 [Malus domestica]|uniref:Uncharacterized protein n=1 Tax=Malus domestica TaxID=3750 RepID=A0A498JFT0_MALDO|nr:hypothetical protein DVH24_011928 [Malus domestica]